jgi:hypothetical protein
VTDLTLQPVVPRLIVYVLAAVVRGFTLAAAAVAMDDQGLRYDGRLRVSPLAHLPTCWSPSPVCSSRSDGFKPIAVDPLQLQLGRRGLPIVVAAGAATTLIVAAALRLMRPLLTVLPRYGLSGDICVD